MALNQSSIAVNEEPQSGFNLVEVKDITKTYGATKAVDGMQFQIRPGEVIGLVGANGAGKSTMMRIVSGVTRPDSGLINFNNQQVPLDHYTPSVARTLGIRVVYQELSLCTNLKVYENFFIEQHHRFTGGNWRKKAYDLTKTALAEVFPNHTIDPAETVDQLTIAQRQMVEIARAACDPDLKLLILDEPTSSLGAEQTTQLENYVLTAKQRGISFIFISHRLREIIALSDQVVVMKNGQLSWSGPAATVTEADLVQKMGGVQTQGAKVQEIRVNQSSKRDEWKVELTDFNSEKLHNLDAKMYAGEIIGLAGLEGSGQKALLQSLYQASKKSKKDIRLNGKIAYVTGDRAREGVFRYWSIAKNTTITKLTWPGSSKLINQKGETEWAQDWYDRLKIKAPGIHTPLVSLSGGNQQKALIARALLSDADIILLDDPSRGVDVDTKKQLYTLFREVAAEGKLIIWYSSEDEELTECDRVLVMREGYIVKELTGTITKDLIIDSSFIVPEKLKDIKEQASKKEDKKKNAFLALLQQRTVMPLIALILVVVAIGILKPDAVSGFGLTLLIGTALPLVLSALSQMFTIAGSDIDLGVGAYIGLINVISATILVKHELLGIVLLFVGVIAYGLLGALIHLRKIPAIVVTLGASFIWLGIAITIQSQPGGSSPDWLSNFFNLSIPFIPEPIILSLLAGVIAYFVLVRSRYGTVLRGFGNNPQSIERSGWSSLKARVSLYMLAGVFGTFTGLAITGITTASDANATSSYTLLTVAAVVMGGGELEGGIVGPFGVVFGAATLSLLGALLGFLNVGSNYQSAVQGSLLFIILAIRIAMRRKA